MTLSATHDRSAWNRSEVDDVNEAGQLAATRKLFETRSHDVSSSPTAPVADHRNLRRRRPAAQFHEQKTLIVTLSQGRAVYNAQHVEKTKEQKNHY